MDRERAVRGFLCAMAEDKRAMQAYAAMEKSERTAVLDRAMNAESRAELLAIVSSLYDEVSAVEFS